MDEEKADNRKRGMHEQEMYLAVSMYANGKTIGDMEFELDKEKFIGRGNLGVPVMVANSKPFSKTTELTLNLICAIKRTISVKPDESANISLIISYA